MTAKRFGIAAAASLAIVLLSQLLPYRSGGGVVFAQVQSAVSQAKTVQYTLTEKVTTDEKKSAPLQTKRVMISGDDRREEVTVKPGDDLGPGRSWAIEPGKYVRIRDGAGKKSIALFPDKREYIVGQAPTAESRREPEESKQASTLPRTDFYELIRDVSSANAQQLPGKMLNGREVVGFVVEETTKQQSGVETWRRTYWVDQKTKLPRQIDVSFQSTVPGVASMDGTLSDIVFDAPLDHTLFSCNPPVDYVDVGLTSPIEAARRLTALQNREQLLTSGLQVGTAASNLNQTIQSTETHKISAQTGEVRSETGFARDVAIMGKYLKRIETKYDANFRSGIEKEIGPLVWSDFVDIYDAKEGREMLLFPELQKFHEVQRRESTNRLPFLFGLWAMQNDRLTLTSGVQDPAADAVRGPDAQELRSGQPGEIGYYELFRKPPVIGQARKLPPSTIEGKSVLGFQLKGSRSIGSVKDSEQKWEKTYWVDPDTMLPVRIESTSQYLAPSQSKDIITNVVIRDIRYDVPLDPALFSTDPPAGYTDTAAKKSADSDKPNAK